MSHCKRKLRSEMKNKLTKHEIDCSYSIFHMIILLSIIRNSENLQTHVLDELNFHFNIIGVTETKITNPNLVCCPTIEGYEFEYVPTPLSPIFTCCTSLSVSHLTVY